MKHPLEDQLAGEVYTDELHRILYATDASVYRQLPALVVAPRHTADIRMLIGYARREGLSLIPRAAGTSLAGQVVGDGIVIDVGRHLRGITEINAAERWVRVQPGVIRDELNAALAPHGLFFAPNTSTANRCMLGGMVGNNSCGTTSIVYGSTRDRTLEITALLSDGSEVVFGPLDRAGFQKKLDQPSLEGNLYRQIAEALHDPVRRASILTEYPAEAVTRRNTGYAIDLLLRSDIFTPGGPPFNFCTLLCGSEGTLAFTTEIKLALDPLPPPQAAIVCAHFSTVIGSMEAVATAMAQQPTLCELMDKTILDLTKENLTQQKNRFFVEGDPAAILLIEVRAANREQLEEKVQQLLKALVEAEHGYAHPVVYGKDTRRVWNLRAAGLGLLANLPGDKKTVACIEDTAVAIADLPAYIEDFTELMAGFGQEAVYYAHAGAGELHLRPLLNLKAAADRQLMYDITAATARLVKQYRGSLSGEHGDGRVRASFLPLMIGEENYALLRAIKQTWDPYGIFNSGKITDAPPMLDDLRYSAEQPTPTYATVFDFSDTDGLLRMAEKCNGSGDCRKLSFSGGTMCPSYRVTRQEKDSTRGRANVLREVLTQNAHEHPFAHPALAEALDLCLSCKGCTAECPSNVDMTTLKAEYLHQRYRTEGVPFAARVLGHIDRVNAWACLWPGLANAVVAQPTLAGWLKWTLGIAPERSLPTISQPTFGRWWKQHRSRASTPVAKRGTVWLWIDEFTNYHDAEVGQAAVRLLTHLGYTVRLAPVRRSARGQLSKGLLRAARRIANENIRRLAPLVTAATPLLGLEPSALLGIRDEYLRLVDAEQRETAQRISQHSLLIEEFLAREIRAGHLTPDDFATTPRAILLHGHCHQKALSNLDDAVLVLSLPQGHHVEVIPSGCCGMAGSFGYERDHYALSMQVGEETLFPAVRRASAAVTVVASGTSCRHQILDGTQRRAVHPVEVLWESCCRAGSPNTIA